MTNILNRLKFAPFYLVSLIPLRILYLIADIGFVLLFYVFRYRRKVVCDNITGSFPEKSDRELMQIERAFYKHFCDQVFENMKFLTISSENAKKRLVVKNPELIQRYYDEKKSVISYTAHLGNWEWLAALPFYVKHQMTAFYQPQTSPYFDQIIKLVRERFGAITIPSKRGYKSLMEFAKKDVLTISLIIGDQGPHPKSSRYWTMFLNQETGFMYGADRIAQKSNQVVVFPAITKPKRGYYEVEFIVLQEEMTNVKKGEIIEKYSKALETAIYKAPHLWLWTHRRWKRQRREDEVMGR